MVGSRTESTIAVFYLSRSPIALEDITRLDEQAGYTCRYYICQRGKELSIFPRRGSRERWIWSGWEQPPARASEKRQKLTDCQPVSSFHITCDEPLLSVLGRFLRDVLEHYRGWVVCGEDWSRTYDIRTIENFA